MTKFSSDAENSERCIRQPSSSLDVPEASSGAQLRTRASHSSFRIRSYCGRAFLVMMALHASLGCARSEGIGEVQGDGPYQRSVRLSVNSAAARKLQEATVAPSVAPTTTASPSISSQPTTSASPSTTPTVSPAPSVSPTPTVTNAIPPTSRPTSAVTPKPSLRPSKRPTALPTDYPSADPTPAPSPEPTVSDIRALTTNPNAPNIGLDDDFFEAPVSIVANQEPDASLTARPNVIPTAIPSDEPSMTPSFGPTEIPTKAPTKLPTLRPTPRPTTPPTFLATPAPSDSPTRSPSPAPTTRPPTRNPTAAPTPNPTPRPTTAATPVPSISPTQEPTLEPTLEPSSMPVTPDPTPSGTLEPTLNPTMFPTVSPSISPEPSILPTGTPTASPTAIPTGSPTETPSIAPSYPEQTNLIIAVMGLFPFEGPVLTGQAAIALERESENTLRRYILQQGLEPPLYDLEVNWNIVAQTALAAETGESGAGGSTRLLQEGEQPAEPSAPTLVVQSDVSVSFRSENTDYDVESWVFEAWQDETDRTVFVANLKRRSPSVFQDIQGVLVDVEGYVPPPPNSGTGTDTPPQDKSNVAVIAGASVGGAALLLLAVFLYVRLSSDRSVDEGHHQSHTTPSTTGQPKVAVSTEILVEPQDDVSTLGDPMFAPGGMLIGGLEKDEVTASVGDDYDYARQYRKQNGQGQSISDRTQDRSRLHSEDFTKSSSAGSATMSKMGRMGESLFADDASFEQQFAEPEERYDVVAPAGKLGMVIDTPNGGMPVVHAIKDTSVLADRVRVGDRLLSVDGEDCTAMSAMQVSKLISLKSEKPARVLVFARARGAAQTEN